MTCKIRRDQIEEEGSCCCDCDCGPTAIRIGCEGVEDAADAIIGILETTVDQETMRKALDTLASLCSVRNVAITGNVIKMSECCCGDDEAGGCRCASSK